MQPHRAKDQTQLALGRWSSSRKILISHCDRNTHPDTWKALTRGNKMRELEESEHPSVWILWWEIFRENDSCFPSTVRIPWLRCYTVGVHHQKLGQKLYPRFTGHLLCHRSLHFNPPHTQSQTFPCDVNIT